MPKYKTTAVITVNEGTFKLSKDQARRRAPFIEESKEHKGFHNVIKPVQFKAGEEIETVEELPKVYWDRVERLDKPKAKEDKGVEKTRAALDEALEQLPGKYEDADYVVNQMRSHFGKVFTDKDEALVRKVVTKKG